MEHKAAIVVLHFLIEAVLVFFFGLISVPSIKFQFFHSGFRSFHLSTLSKIYFKVGNIYVQWWLPLNSFLYNYFESCIVVSVTSIGPKSVHHIKGIFHPVPYHFAKDILATGRGVMPLQFFTSACISFKAVWQYALYSIPKVGIFYYSGRFILYSL